MLLFYCVVLTVWLIYRRYRHYLRTVCVDGEVSFENRLFPRLVELFRRIICNLSAILPPFSYGFVLPIVPKDDMVRKFNYTIFNSFDGKYNDACALHESNYKELRLRFHNMFYMTVIHAINISQKSKYFLCFNNYNNYNF